MPSKKTVLIIFVCALVVACSFVVRTTFAKGSYSSQLRSLLEIMSKNEGEVYPKIKFNAEDFPELSAKSYMVVFDGSAGEKSLVAKNSDERMPIASITKLTTSMVTLNSSAALLAQLSSSTIDVASEGRYAVNDILPVKELVKSMLVESDNDAARAICKNESENFIDRMNSYARYVGAQSTYFYNCTGLDGEGGGTNISTAHDVIEILRSLVRTHQELLSVISAPTAPILRMDGSIHHVAVSTYEFRGEELPFPVIVGKTGQTDLAKQNLVLALQAPRGVLYVAVLGSEDRFEDMKKLVQYIHNSFEW